MRSLHEHVDAFEVTKAEYSNSVTAWNDRLNAFCVTLTIFGEHTFTDRLQTVIQPKFVTVTAELDQLLRDESKVAGYGKSSKWFDGQLNQVTGLLWSFSRDLSGFLLRERNEAYNGLLIPFCVENLELFSTWYLIKALFEPRKELQPICSTALDPESPFFTSPARPWVYKHRS